ncbi:MAG: hypothetical protein WD151_14455 [Phycisphaeraceae bacterium]
MSVEGALFGSYGSEITYGALSLDSRGLPTYGDVFCRLRPVAVADRVSFLEKNSYAFIDEHNIGNYDSWPPGHRAVWKTRHLLASAKLGHEIHSGQTVSDWQRLLISSDGKERNNDEFIEAHLYGGFNIHAIEAISIVDHSRLSRSQRLEAKVLQQAFEKHLGQSGALS